MNWIWVFSFIFGSLFTYKTKQDSWLGRLGEIRGKGVKIREGTLTRKASIAGGLIRGKARKQGVLE